MAILQAHVFKMYFNRSETNLNSIFYVSETFLYSTKKQVF